MATKRPGRTSTTTTTSSRGSQNQGLGQTTGAAVGGAVGAAGDALGSAAASMSGARGRAGGVGGSGTTSTRARTDAGADQELSVTVNREGSGQSTQRTGGVSRQRNAFPNMFGAALLPGAFMANPFEFMRRMSEQMDQMLGGPSSGQGMQALQSGTAGSVDRQRGLTGSSGSTGLMTGWAPQIEVVQREDEIVVRADLPGLTRDDIDVEVNEGVLTISGERRQESRDEREGFIRSERSYGSFYRAIPLPETVDPEEISASFRDGVLEISVPVPENQQRRRRVEIT